MQCKIREYGPKDLDSLATIYRDSIRQLGSEYYSAAQVETWSSFADDAEEFCAWISNAFTLVAVDQGSDCLGFGGLQPQGRISSLFVSPQFKRMGIASSLLSHLLNEVRSRGFDVVTAEASEFSRPLFEKYGFFVSEVEHTQFKGVDFSRYAMRART